jgi:hypothetical protein
MGVGQVGLEHDARRAARELRLVQQPAEQLHGQVEVPVLLHVEAHELRHAVTVRASQRRLHRGAVEPPQPFREDREHVVPGEQLELGRDRRDLDGDALDARPRERVEGARQARLGLAFTDDGLAELVHVDAYAFPHAAVEGALQRSGLPRHDHAGRLAAHPRENEGDQETGEARAECPEGAELCALEGAQVAGQAVAVDQMGDLVGHAGRVARARDLVGERRREALASRVVHQPRESGLRAAVAGARAREGQRL